MAEIKTEHEKPIEILPEQARNGRGPRSRPGPWRKSVEKDDAAQRAGKKASETLQVDTSQNRPSDLDLVSLDRVGHNLFDLRQPTTPPPTMPILSATSTRSAPV